MKNFCTITLALVLAVALLPASAMAADYGDTFPEGFTFWADSTGDKIIVGGDAQASDSAGTQLPEDYGKTKTAEDIAAFADELFKLVNEQREEHGLNEVERCEEMDAVAMIRAQEMSECWGHYRPDGTWYTTLADEKGIEYTYIGENGAMNAGSSEPHHQVSGWMRSDGHRANMLLEKHTKVGIGVYYSGQYCYVSLMLYY